MAGEAAKVKTPSLGTTTAISSRSDLITQRGGRGRQPRAPPPAQQTGSPRAWTGSGRGKDKQLFK